MFAAFFIFLASLVILFLPLVFWLYIFTQFSHYHISRFQFIFGVISGACMALFFVWKGSIGVFSVLFENLLEPLSFIFISNIFFYCSLFFLALWLCVSVLAIYKNKNLKILRNYSFTYMYIVLTSVIAIMMISVSYFLFAEKVFGSTPVSLGALVFYTGASIFGYYVLIALLEEGIKFIAGYSFYSGEKVNFQIQKIFCIGACVSLGFAFCENILYVFIYIYGNGIDLGVLSLSFFRSIFAVILHIFAGVFMVLAFYYILFTSTSYLIRISLFVGCSFFSLMSHSMYDTALTFEHPGVLFLYFIGIYFLVTYIGFRENI